MTIRRTALALLTGTAMMAAGTVAVTAQETMEPADPMEQNTAPMEPADPMMTAPAADFSTPQLEAFAVAFVQVNEIGMSYDQQMQAATSDEELMGLQMQAQEEMTQVVEAAEGISVEEYNQIFQAAQIDPELGGEIQTYIDAQLQ